MIPNAATVKIGAEDLESDAAEAPSRTYKIDLHDATRRPSRKSELMKQAIIKSFRRSGPPT